MRAVLLTAIIVLAAFLTYREAYQERIPSCNPVQAVGYSSVDSVWVVWMRPTPGVSRCVLDIHRRAP